jgi:methionyl-tRNA formyltransferase
MIVGFYTPPLHAIEILLQENITPENICLLTYDVERNQMLIDYARTNCIETKFLEIRSQDALDYVSDFQPDVLFSLYYRDIIPKEILNIPRLGAVNLHPSLLPKYRGTFSAPWVIINGEEITGFTYHYMLESIDTGNIILQEQVTVRPDDTAIALYNRLLIEGTSCFLKVFDLVTKERYKGVPQEGESSYYSRNLPFDGYIDPSWTLDKVDRFIRAMYFPPFKGAIIRLIDGSEREILSISEYQKLVDNGDVPRSQGQ